VDFWIVYNLTRLYGLSHSSFVWIYAGLTAALLVPRVVFGLLGTPIFVVLMTGATFSEIMIAYPGLARRLGASQVLRADRRWLWVALGVYLPAFAIWYASDSGRPLCKPESLIQGHTIWHVLTALSPGALYLYFLVGDKSYGPAEVTAD